MALFLSMGKDPEEGGEVGLSYAFISHTMQLVIMIVMGIISIPMLARARNELVKKAAVELKLRISSEISSSKRSFQ